MFTSIYIIINNVTRHFGYYSNQCNILQLTIYEIHHFYHQKTICKKKRKKKEEKPNFDSINKIPAFLDFKIH